MVAPGCMFAHVWRVTLLNLRYLSLPCGEQICLTHYIHFSMMVQPDLQLVISSESRLDASSLKTLKTEVGCFNDVNYSRWSCGFNYFIVRQALKWLIV